MPLSAVLLCSLTVYRCSGNLFLPLSKDRKSWVDSSEKLINVMFCLPTVERHIRNACLHEENTVSVSIQERRRRERGW